MPSRQQTASPNGHGSAEVVRRKISFFEKKTQKTFASFIKGLEHDATAYCICAVRLWYRW
jgi:hypothetical protein